MQRGVTGATFPAKDAQALAEAVSDLLSDEVNARRMARRAKTMVRERYGWATVAEQTARAYRTAVLAGPASQADRAAARLSGERTRIVVPEGNLLALDGVAS